MVLMSNNVKMTAPIRLRDDQLQFNVGAMIDHLNLTTECMLVCSRVPGLKNLQENFSGNAAAPDGLAAPVKKGATKRKAEMTVAQLALEGNARLPYSYDLIPMGISITMAKTFYNDLAENVCKTFCDEFGEEIHFKPDTSRLPEFSLRFPGYDERNRQSISLPVATQRPPEQAHCEAGDTDEERSGVSEDQVSRSIGKHATEADIESYIRRKQGMRSMRGVSGDLFAYSTWLNHTATTLVSRGLMTSDPEERALLEVADMPHCLNLRFAEGLSEIGDPDFAFLGLKLAKPGTYGAISKKKREIGGLSAKRICVQGGTQKVNVGSSIRGFGAFRRGPRGHNNHEAGSSADAMEVSHADDARDME